MWKWGEGQYDWNYPLALDTSIFINNEFFEAYPNRNSIPYIAEYMLPKEWRIEEFVRGTLRLKGWSKAWKDIFDLLEEKSPDLEKKIKSKCYV